MKLLDFVLVSFVPSITKAASPRRAVECDFATNPENGATCESFASNWGLDVSDLKQLNPGIACPSIDTSKEYCVVGTVNSDPIRSSTTSKTSFIPSKTSSLTTLKPSTTTKTPTASHQPQMPGLAKNCDGFYKVSSGDSCDTISKKHSISTSQFLSWNSEINAQCTNLWLDYYVCIHAPGTATTTKSTSSPKPTSGTNQPQMPGIVSNCKKYHKVVSGDSCWSIYNAAGITLKQFLSYNTYVDSGCSNLWLDYYVCTGI